VRITNAGGSVTAADVKTVRAKTTYPTYDAHVKASSYAPLPKAVVDLELKALPKIKVQ
jgi:hypothetical protein